MCGRTACAAVLKPREPRRPSRRLIVAALSLGLLAAGFPTSTTAQTISGTLLDLDTDRPIPLGLVMMFTTGGDSITATVSDAAGRFQVTSPEPGSFVLVAEALGYEETPAGVFELGPDGEMQVEYRLPSRPLPIDEVLVSIDRPIVQHHLVRNGFVSRFQRGFGHFITPYDIENSPARSTEALMEGIPRVQVRTTRGGVGGIGLAMPHLGETVQVMGPMGWCTPKVYVDGLPMAYNPGSGFTLTQFAPLHAVEAIEVYRRPTEFPVEFSPRKQRRNSATQDGCGIVVVWTKQGLAPGQRPAFGRPDGLPAGGLPEVDNEGPAPLKGETVRIALDEEEARSRGLASPWQATFETVEDGYLVALDEDSGQPFSLPVEAVSVVQVARRKGALAAWRRGFVGGAAVGVGTWAFLSILCEWTCGDPGQARQETVLPGVIAGVFVGGVVVSRGPGTQWVRTSLSDREGESGSVPARRIDPYAPSGSPARYGLELRPGPLPGTLRLGWRLPVR